MRRFGALLAALALAGCGGGDSGFDGSVQAVDRARLQTSWRPGCPVPPEDLRLLTVEHWDFDGQVRIGELVVHDDVADEVVRVFRSLYEERFSIARMRLVDAYGADDVRSMAANNSSAFNCRLVAGTGRWSEHAYGRAVDLNPVQNPYVSATGEVSPQAGEPYADRTRRAPGMIHPGGEVVQAFADIGWLWGGDFRSAKDYQHFSATGR